jgi:hypothetical protein
MAGAVKPVASEVLSGRAIAGLPVIAPQLIGQGAPPMSSTLIGILITFLVVILVLYLVNMLPIDGRAKQIVRVIVIVIGVISLLKYLAVLPF